MEKHYLQNIVKRHILRFDKLFINRKRHDEKTAEKNYGKQHCAIRIGRSNTIK